MNKKKLLALLMALVMTLTLVPVTALAEGEVARVESSGEVYPTLQGAIDNAPDGATVTLLADVSGSFTISRSLTLEAAEGAEITGSGTTALLINASNVTVVLNGITVKSGASRGVGINTNCSGAHLTINDCTIGAEYYAIDTRPGADDAVIAISDSTINGWSAMNIWGDHGTITIEDSDLTGINDKTQSSSNDSAVILIEADTSHRDLNDALARKFADGNSITLTNCNIGATTNTTNSQAIVAFNAYGEDIAKGENAEYYDTGYHAKNNVVTFEACSYVATTTGGLVYDGASVLKSGKSAAATIDETYGNQLIVKTSGTYTCDPSAYLAEGYKAVNNGNTWTVSAKDVAQIVRTGEKFETLDAAITAASADDTVKLLQDITYDADHPVTVWQKAVNLDLDGHKLATHSTVSVALSNMGYQASAICYDVTEGAVTISNGTIETDYGAGVYAASDKIGNPFVVTLKDLTINANKYAVQQTDEYSSAVRITTGAKVIIESGSYTGYNAIAVSNSGGEFEIKGGTFDGKIFFSSNTDSGMTKSITIEGGKFKGDFVNPGKGTLTISGGHFTADPTLYLANGYKKVTSTEESYQWMVQSSAVAQIGTTEYTTLAAAFADANAAGTANIQVIADCEITEPLAVGANSNITLTINEGVTVTAAATANGIEVTSTANGIEVTSQNACGYTLIQNSGKLKITGTGTIDGSAIASGTEFIYNKDTNPSPKTMYLINNDGEITIESGTFKMYPKIKSVVLRSEGTANLKGGTFSAWSAVLNDDGGVMTVNGGTYRGWAYSTNPAGYRYAFAQYGTDSSLTINNGDFKGVHGTLGVSVGHTTVNDGTFETRGVIRAREDNEEVPESLPDDAATFYTVYAAGERGVVDITINGGDFFNAGSSAAVLWIGNDSTPGDGGIGADASAAITGGTFTQRNNKNVFYVSENTGGSAITGGTYVGAKFNGTSYVVDGYEAVETGHTGKTYTYQVGKVKATNLTKQDDATTETSATFTAKKAVVDENDQTIGNTDQTTMTVTVTGNNTETDTVAQATLGNVMSTKLEDIVSAAIVAAGSGITPSTTEANVVIQVAKTSLPAETGKVTYEVHPEAVISVGGNNVGTVKLTNDQINGTFTFKLNVSSIAEEGEYVRIDHMENDAVLDSKTYRVGEDGYVEITGIERFSIFVGEKVDEQNEYFTYLGASVRRRVQTSSREIVVNSCTDMRFGFVVKNYSPSSSYDKYYFQWTKDGVNWSSPVEITNFANTDGEWVASLVITNIPATSFDTKITAKIYKEGEDSALEGDAMSVIQVANAIITKYGNGTSQKQWVDYAKYLTTQSGSYTVTYDENDHVNGYTYTATAQ